MARGSGFAGEVAEWNVVRASVEPVAAPPCWGLAEIAAYLHVSTEEALRRLWACGLSATLVEAHEPRWSAQLIIDARDNLGTFVPHPR